MREMTSGRTGSRRSRRRPPDQLDESILAVLQDDARASVAEIAKRVGTPEATCRYRLKRLEERGIIGKYRAVLPPEKLGFILFVFFMIKIKGGNENNMREFADFLRVLDGVFMIDAVHGTEYDFIVKSGYSTPKNMREMHSALRAHPLCEDIHTVHCVENIVEYRVPVKKAR